MTFADTTGKLARPALSVELTDRVRELIMEGELKEGHKVPERYLTERFGVSRTPLREAIKVLAHEGFVVLVPNRGAVVAPQSLDEIEEILPIVGALEGLAGELAAQHASDADIRNISRLTDRLREAFEARDRPTYFQINQSIHAAIIQAAGNPALLRNHATFARRIYRARYQANLSESRWKEATEEHEKIAEALAARDAKGLGELLREHLSHKMRSIRSALK
ncbi:GntR family transcriptional regulator [Aquamicrobium sp. LC103]|uniref:GntR family transcriptional regulator n=1 Tax=Aquamicrobium sp. LC103 TaxID=1120658 RepID=UPI00063E8EB8|nr:GntR family transcriptional regulator [Aquamicrobium sp. LC103]TKT82486.1 GntR family transcriptional regulator [Aquamicrobium sp. LC103]